MAAVKPGKGGLDQVTTWTAHRVRATRDGCADRWGKETSADPEGLPAVFYPQRMTMDARVRYSRRAPLHQDLTPVSCH